MTRDEFKRWKHDGKEVWRVVEDRIHSLEKTIAREAGQDALSDRFKAGCIWGMEAVLDIDWEDEDAENQRT